MKKSPRIFFPATLTAALLTACGSDPGFDLDTAFENPQGSVQFVNMATGSPLLTVAHGLTSSLQLSYGWASEATSRPADDYDWRITYRGANGDEIAVAEGDDAAVVAGSRHTFFIMGSIDNASVRVVDQPEPTAERIATGSAEAWFAANADAPAMMDIYITESGASLDGLAATLTLSNGATSDLVTIDSLTNRQVRITRAADPSALLFDSGPLDLADQGRQLYAIISNAGPDGGNHVDVIAASGTDRNRMDNHAQPTRVRVANLTGRDPVSVALGQADAGLLAQAAQSAYLDAPPGNLNITVSDEDGNPVGMVASTIAVGKFNSIYLFEDADSGDLTAIQTEDEHRAVRERVNFRFVSASSDAIDLYVLRDGNGVDDVSPSINDVDRGGGPLTETSPGMVGLAVTNSDGSETLATSDATFATGNSYTLVFDGEATLALYTQDTAQ